MDVLSPPHEQGEHYESVARAIQYLAECPSLKPDLETVAKEVGLSPFHFQRMFVRWAGVSPKEFCRLLDAEAVKRRLVDGVSTYQTAADVGLSSGSRLHDLMISVEGMSPGEYKRQGEGLEVSWAVFPTPFGTALIAKSQRGIVKLTFLLPEDEPDQELKQALPRANLIEDPKSLASEMAEISGRMEGAAPTKTLGVLLSGSPFRTQVWRALLSVPPGQLVSYQGLALLSGMPQATRAVASSVASNQIAFLIPCHRVIRSTGVIGQYRWGAERKRLMVVREAVS